MSDSSSPQRRSTKQREAVLHAVSHSKTHPTAEEVYNLTIKQIPAISLATVYRNLGLLVEEGLIREVQFHGDVLRYDGMLDAHEHFYCRTCGHVIDLPQTLSSRSLDKVEAATGCKLERYALDYYGLCAKCNSKK